MVHTLISECQKKSYQMLRGERKLKLMNTHSAEGERIMRSSQRALYCRLKGTIWGLVLVSIESLDMVFSCINSSINLNFTNSQNNKLTTLQTQRHLSALFRIGQNWTGKDTLDIGI